MRRLALTVGIAAAAAAAVFGIAPGAFAQDADDDAAYTVTFSELNDSGVAGTADLSMEGGELTVSITANGLESGEAHAQHIHGLADGSDASCPTDDDDADGDGTLTLVEGLPIYGPVEMELTPFPTGEAIDYEETFTTGIDAVTPLEDHVIVLHGMTVDGAYDGSIPVACGNIELSGGGGGAASPTAGASNTPATSSTPAASGTVAGTAATPPAGTLPASGTGPGSDGGGSTLLIILLATGAFVLGFGAFAVSRRTM